MTTMTPEHQWATEQHVCIWCGISKIEPNGPCPKHPRAVKPARPHRAADDVDAIYARIQELRKS